MNGDKNPMWKGDDVGYKSLHEWINNHKPKPEYCECCNTASPIDLANISGEYRRDIDDFEWLCRKCHMTKDGRLDNLKEFSKDKKLSQRERTKRNKEHRQRYRNENLEEIRRKDRERYKKNKDKINERHRNHYKENKTEILKRRREIYHEKKGDFSWKEEIKGKRE